MPGHAGLKYLSYAVWLAAVAVLVLRNASAHSCPWDLAAFGGRAGWFPLFGDPPANAGPGRCLPAAHASSGFALFGLYFALRGPAPRAGRLALAAALLIGFAAGAVQVARGAHFASHVLWTACIAYGVNLALARLLALRRARAGS